MTTKPSEQLTQLLTVTIDGVDIEVPKGTLVIRAAEEAGIHIPRFCDHPLLKPAGACRQCLVEVSAPDREGNLRPMPKPQASCTLEATDGMRVATQNTSEVADEAQHGVMEFLLINHPLDCPVCDKGGECPLQNQAMSNGRATSRFTDVKRTFPKPLKISSQILLDRDRCILCQRCTRFSEEIAGDPFIALQGRGGGTPGSEIHGTPGQQVGTFDARVLDFALPEEAGDGSQAGSGGCGSGGGGCGCGTQGGNGQVTAESPTSGPDGEPSPTAGHASGPLGVAETDTSGRPFSSYFSGNTIQICPVGALTSAAYRFRSRPFDLVSTESVAEHDASGAAIRIDHRRGVVVRRLSGDDPEVNEEWITDKDRFAFAWQSAGDRLDAPMVRDETTGELVATSWSEALDIAARGLAAARDGAGVGLLPGGRGTLEDAYAWSRFARAVLGTNDIDHRARPHSEEEAQFLAHRVAGTGLGVTFTDLEKAPAVLLVAFEPEEEAGNVFLRLRKGVLAGDVSVTSVAPFASRGSTKLRADVLATAPGGEAGVLDAIADGGEHASLAEALARPGALVLVGERAGALPGALSAVERLVSRTGAALAWIPRRAGDRAAVDAGLLPGLLPGGRLVADAEARVDLATVWGVESIPAEPGRDLDGILAAAGGGALGALVVGGLDLDDLPDPAAAGEALESVGFVVQLEVRASAVTEHADVVFPVAPPVEKAGTFVNWEGRRRPFGQVLTTRVLTDRQVLDALASELGVDLAVADLRELHAQLAELADWEGRRGEAPRVAAPDAAEPAGAGRAVLATWRLQLDAGRGQDGEPHLAGTAHRPAARLSATTAEAIGATEGRPVIVRTDAGEITLPLTVAALPDGVVWLPENSVGSQVRRSLRARPGDVVSVEVAR